MRFFKNRFVAFVLSAIIVIASTLVSVNIRFGNECQKITDGFYDGVYYDGYVHDSIASQLRDICAAAQNIEIIAEDKGLNTEDLSWMIEDLDLAVTYGPVSYAYYTYKDLMSECSDVERQLKRLELDERDSDNLELQLSTIVQAQDNIQVSGYNESVREFLREEAHFPARQLAEMAGLYMPDLFE